jgi:alpha-mannosidase
MGTGFYYLKFEEFQYEIIEKIQNKVKESGYANIPVFKMRLEDELTLLNGEVLSFITDDKLVSLTGKLYSYEDISLKNLCIILDSLI